MATNEEDKEEKIRPESMDPSVPTELLEIHMDLEIRGITLDDFKNEVG